MNLTPLGSQYFATSAFIGRAVPSSTVHCLYLALFSTTVAQALAGTMTELAGTGYARKQITVNNLSTGVTTQWEPRQRFVQEVVQWTGGAGGWGTARSIGLCAAGTPTVADAYWVADLVPEQVMSEGANLTFQAQKLWQELGPLRAGSAHRLWGKWYAYAMMQAHINGLAKDDAHFKTVANWTGSGPLRALSIHLGIGEPSYIDGVLYANKGLGEFTEMNGNGYDKTKKPYETGAGPKPIMFSVSGAYPYYVSNTNEVVFETVVTAQWDPTYAMIVSWFLESGSSWASAIAQEVVAVIPLWNSVANQSYWRTPVGNALTIPVGTLKLNNK